MSRHIHILGASGSGTTTLGKRLADRIDGLHLDTDEFYWDQTGFAFEKKRAVEERVRLIEEQIEGQVEGDRSWVLSGSLCSWGDRLIRHFTDVVFLWAPWEIRERRLLAREASRYGHQALELGGLRHENHVAFIEWASRYDSAGLEQRSRRTHEEWYKNLPSRIRFVRVEEQYSIEDLAEHVSVQLGI